MTAVATVVRREIIAAFSNPVAAIFILAFVALSLALTFHLGGFFARGQADLESFFRFHPWLHLFLMPALGMRLWAEERRHGTVELLLTLPLSPTALVLGKFFAAWLMAGLALAATLSMPLTVAILGAPDPLPIATGYFGSWLMAGGFLAIAASVSILTRNQVIAFVGGAAACFVLVTIGFDLGGSGFGTVSLRQFLAPLSVLEHYDDMVSGHVTLQGMIFFTSLIATALFINVRLLEGLRVR